MVSCPSVAFTASEIDKICPKAVHENYVICRKDPCSYTNGFHFDTKLGRCVADDPSSIIAHNIWFPTSENLRGVPFMSASICGN
jgi:hypothetical protein